MWVHSWDDKAPAIFQGLWKGTKAWKTSIPFATAAFSRGLNTSGLDSLPCVTGNGHDSLTIRGTGHPSRESTFKPILSGEGWLSSLFSHGVCLPRLVSRTLRQRLQCRGRKVPSSARSWGSDNKEWKQSILPSWLQLDPDTLWAFECTYGEDSSPGIVPAGSTNVKSMKATKAWTSGALQPINTAGPRLTCGHSRDVALPLTFTYLQGLWMVLNLYSECYYPRFAEENNEAPRNALLP